MAEIPIQRKQGRNIWPLIIGLIVLLAVLWFVFTRNRNGNTAAAPADSTAVASNGAVTTDTAAGATASGMAGGGMAGASSTSANAGATNAALTDADIIGVIHAVNRGEVDAGKIASTKASNADVKSFARDMVKDHQALDAQDSKLASSAGGAGQNKLSDSVTSANEATTSQLQSANSGASFDKAYLDAQVAGHQNALSFLQRAQGSAQSADLKRMISSAIPDVQKHLDRAKSLQSKVAP